VFLCFDLRADLVAQVINETVEKAGVTLDHYSVNAGEPVAMTVILNTAPTQQLTIGGAFSTNIDSFNFTVNVPAGVSTVSLSIQTPRDAHTGDYLLSSMYIAGQRISTPLQPPAPPVKLHVDALPSSVTLPSKVAIQIDLTQKQYLRQEAEPLKILRTRLITFLEARASEPEPVKQELITTLEAADKLLPEVKRRYIGLYLKPPPPDLSPLVFDDFHVRYQAALAELNAPPAPGQKASGFGSKDEFPKLTNVQLQKRPGSDWNTPALSGTYSLLATAAVDLLDWNIRAYLLIATTGSDTFTIRLASFPTGATVAYKRAGENYTNLTKPTNIESITFPYALWTFRFERKGCETQEETPNPYIEDNPDIVVELSCRPQ
jgi:hypothetical protein